MDLNKTTSVLASSNLFKFRFPFVAAEVLTGDNDTVLGFLLPQGNIKIEEDVVEEVEVEEEYEI